MFVFFSLATVYIVCPSNFVSDYHFGILKGIHIPLNRIGRVMVSMLASSGVMVSMLAASGVMVSMLAASAVDRGFKQRSGQTKDYNISIYCFSAKHTALRRKNKDWLAPNQDNVSEWGDIFIRGLLFQ